MAPKVFSQYTYAAAKEPSISKKELRKPRTENVGAEKGFYVDHTCIGRRAVAIFISRFGRGRAFRLHDARAIMRHQL